ncbi:protein NEOXANTHIN-DEFICIENT 1 isoform X2 [Arachis duranensis]|uniref:Protein NEOXANTHIN-DEFICIENT 1 isoform X2 n=1 Tax=Arachis duranensis TaxID=130453 RepID=A0A9C6TD23_ARADU|nr:protein NEOXANTHIN-DEFICIENT 1 isoform X2 [Arachis duranensis]
MEAVEAKSSSSSGYGKPPWVFRGSALYQLHLVKAEKARRYIPKEFKLVEAFGYTLGGFFLASYEDSPAGVFDELVVIAGLVWNRPTSCAWATRVYVNSNDACYHGRKEVGLPSQIAKFSKTIRAISGEPSDRSSGFLNMIGIGSISCNNQRDQGLNVEVIKIKCLEAADACNISLTSADGSVCFAGIEIERLKHNIMFVGSETGTNSGMGPPIKMSLPSFSGGTEYNPNLLKYSCRIECRVQAVQPLKVSGAIPSTSTNDEREQHNSDVAENHESFSTYVMLSKPILALKFNQMKMHVEAPVVLSQFSSSIETTASSLP